ncbi:MAG: hypothetical protein ACRDZX_03015 [Acidimicrobiales bacterium]
MSTAPTLGARRVWIDTDPAVGVPGADVDDGYALLQALRSPELEVAGVSTIFGNAPIEVAYPISAERSAWRSATCRSAGARRRPRSGVARARRARPSPACSTSSS